MQKIKEYSTAWLKEEIRIAQEDVEANPHLAATLLLGDLQRYVEHISKNAHRKGRGTSEKKAASSAANGAKGGRPKGSKNKPKDAAMYENLEALRSLPHAKHDAKGA